VPPQAHLRRNIPAIFGLIDSVRCISCRCELARLV
jgi:hypothetical protein